MKKVFYLDFANMNVLEYYFADAEGCHLALKNGIELLGDLNDEEFNKLYEGMPIAYYKDDNTGAISFWLLEKNWQETTTFLYDDDEVETAFEHIIVPDSPGNLIFVRAAAFETIKSCERAAIGYDILTQSGKKLLCKDIFGKEIIYGVTQVVCAPNCPDGDKCVIAPKVIRDEDSYQFGSAQVERVMGM